MRRKEIPIFFSTDDNYIPFLVVAIRSLIDNALDINRYRILILNSGILEENINIIKSFETENCKIEFVNVNDKIKDINEHLSYRLRDYYSNSIYYRIFIASLFPNYDKALYLDSDIVLVDDIANLYYSILGDHLIGAVTDDVVHTNEVFSKYAIDALGINSKDYFNSGILLMNLKGLREEKIEEKFIHLISTYNFDVIAPDQDYLNFLCKGRVKYFHKGWDRMALIEDASFDERDLHLIHYNMFQKPWNYSGIPYEEEFWSYAKKTPYYEEICKMKENYPKEQVEKDAQAGINLVNRAANIIKEKNTFINALPNNWEEDYNKAWMMAD